MDSITEEYKRLKEKHPGDILLFQVGIFYRIMLDDARKVAGQLGLKLLISGEADDPLIYCGFPKSGLDKYTGKLVRAGFYVAVAGQVKLENGGVRREISEVIRCSKT